MLLRLATRASPLALWQARHVASLLTAGHEGLRVELVTVATAGDRASQVPVWEMGGRGVFVGEVQAAVLEGRADAAVHSAKDLQPVAASGLTLAATPERADPRDALVGCLLSDLGPGTVVATGSQRRRAQLAALRPGLVFESLRGNIATRLGRVPAGGAVVVAMAALRRLDLAPAPMEVLGTDVMLPQVAQGAIAVECRAGDREVLKLVEVADHAPTRVAVEAERAFLATLGGGCDLPVAGYAQLEVGEQGDEVAGFAGAGAAAAGFAGAGRQPAGRLRLDVLLAAPDGGVVVRRSQVGAVADRVALGRQVAEAVLAGGGNALLSAYKSRGGR